MTLGRLIELYQAEQNGKTIICRTTYSGYYTTTTVMNEVKITEVDLKGLILNDEDRYSTFFIKEDEDEYGAKTNNK